MAADRQHHREIGCDDLRVELGRLVLFVDEGNGRASGAFPGQLKVLAGQRRRAVEHRQHQPRLVQLLPTAADALGLDEVFGVPQTGGVEEVQPDVPQPHRLFHHIAGRARHRGDDGSVESGQQGQQGGFSRVGPAHDGAVHALPQNGPGVVVLDEGVQLVLHAAQHGLQMGFVQFGDILFGEVHPRGQMGL